VRADFIFRRKILSGALPYSAPAFLRHGSQLNLALGRDEPHKQRASKFALAERVPSGAGRQPIKTARRIDEMARYTEQNVYYAKRMALYGKGGTSGEAGRRHPE